MHNMAASTIVVLCAALVAWDANGQTIGRQPLGDEGTEGLMELLSMSVQVSNLVPLSQVMAIRRESDVIIDNGFKREDVFTSLGLDSSKYSLSETFNSDSGVTEYTLNLNNPTRIDSADFAFLVCRRSAQGRCNQDAVELTSAGASFTVNYVPDEEAYPNCTSDGPQLPSETLGDGDGERVQLNTPTVLSCLSEIGQPPIQLAWEKNGAGVSTETKDAGSYRYGRHAFTPSLADEAAMFICNMTPGLTDPDYPSRSCVLEINVVSKPAVEITYEDTKDYIITGSTVDFTCLASTETSTVNATVWTVPEELLRNTTDRYEIIDDKFTLKQVKLVDDGVILACTVTDNDGMEGSSAVTLQVIDATDFSTNLVTVPTTTTVNPTTQQPMEYAAIVIGLVFAGLLLFLLVVMVILFYWRKRTEKKPKPVNHPATTRQSKPSSLQVPKSTERPSKSTEWPSKSTEQPSKSTERPSTNIERSSTSTVVHQQGTTVKEKQLSHDQSVLCYSDPDVVPQGSRLSSPARGDSLARQRAAPSRTRCDDIPLEDRHPALTHDKYRYDTHYDRSRDNYNGRVLIDSGNPEKGSHHDADTDNDRHPDHRRYDDYNHRPPSDAGRYDYDNRGYNGKYEKEHSHDGRYEDPYGDYPDADNRSAHDDRAYDDRAYDDRAYDRDQGPYSRDDGSYEDGYGRSSYGRPHDDRYEDYGKPEYDQRDREGDDPYRPAHEGSYGRRTSSDYSEQRSYGGSYDCRISTADRYDNNAGMYILQDDDYDDHAMFKTG